MLVLAAAGAVSAPSHVERVVALAAPEHQVFLVVEPEATVGADSARVVPAPAHPQRVPVGHLLVGLAQPTAAALAVFFGTRDHYGSYS